MGLTIHSLGHLPTYVERAYYVYLLDYGWKEPLAEALEQNFERMSKAAEESDAVVIRGIVKEHFADEVLSWHHVNGRDAESEKLLPAILITTISPHDFKESRLSESEDNRLLLIPLQETCKSSTDVANLIVKIFDDIRNQRELADFEIVREQRRNKVGSYLDCMELKPNVAGMGVNLNKVLNRFLGKGPDEAT